jgi:hypothetical protein
VMLDRLKAEGPNPAHVDELMLFGQLVGSWGIDMTAIDPEGDRRAFLAEWHVGWT